MNEVIANQTWSNFLWPDWVPEGIQEEIKDFWRESWGRGPAAWHENAIANKAPLFGDRVRVHGLGPGGDLLTGRIVFAWNNIGRLLGDDGEIHYVAVHGFEVSRDGLWRKPNADEFASAGEPLPFYGQK